ncbi:MULTISPECIES: hypothetical protein [Gilvibacter]|nr:MULTISPECIES: hypothetical protein [Gilvibacter]MDC7998297.1 hypothetical protein [Gilvibacter sediminis]
MKRLLLKLNFVHNKDWDQTREWLKLKLVEYARASSYAIHR